MGVYGDVPDMFPYSVSCESIRRAHGDVPELSPLRVHLSPDLHYDSLITYL